MRYSLLFTLSVSASTLIGCGSNTTNTTVDSGASMPDASPPPSCVRDHLAPDGIAVDTSTPRFQLINEFPSTNLGNKRTIRVFLPASYDTDTSASYPVVYMHDGQNLFDSATAAFGREWEVDETVDRLVAEAAIPEVIVVGIDNTPDRIDEYTPTEDPDFDLDPAGHKGGKGALYGKFVVEELKPYIDTNYRTACEVENTAVIGSSLGGLISFEMAWRYPSIFGMAGVVSPSLWWDERELLTRLQEATPESAPTSKIWIDMGTAEGQDDTDQDGLLDTVDNARDARDRLLALGYTFGESLGSREVAGAGHNEPAWAARFDDILLFLLGKDQAPGLSEVSLVVYGDKVALQGADKDKMLHTSVSASYENGLDMTVPGSLTSFAIANTDIAIIDAQGVISSVALGSTTVQATYGGKSSPEVPFEVVTTLPMLVDIIFDVTVPDNTPADKVVTIGGNLNGYMPRQDSYALQKVGNTNTWQATFRFERGTNLGFKFTLQPQAADPYFNVEKGANCEEISDRVLMAESNQTYRATVLNWRNNGTCRD